MNLFAMIFSACVYYIIEEVNAKSQAPGFASYGNGTHGGEAGKTYWNVTDPMILEQLLSDNIPRIICILGKIDLTTLFNGSPGVMLDVGSYKTVIGLDKAEITGGGLRIKNQKQVIIRNLKFTNALSYAPGERPDGAGGIINQRPGDFTEVDAIVIERSTHVWIDHNEFSDDPWIATQVLEGRKRHDGLVDIKRGSNYITVSNNIFSNHNKNILVGHSDTNIVEDLGKLKVTFVGNWFNGTIQRNPRVRFGEVHVVNNLYTNIHMYGIGIGDGARIYSEGNVFEDSAAAFRHPSWNNDRQGCLYYVDTLFSNTEFGIVRCLTVGWKPSQYYIYRVMNSNEVRDSVTVNAGIKPIYGY